MNLDSPKIVTWKTLQKLRSEWKKEQLTLVFTNGCFDILHAGHVKYLRDARTLGDLLVVGVNSDDSVRRLKGNNRPVQPESDRAYILSGLESVDYVTLFDQDTPAELIEAIKPDILVKGGDYTPDEIVGAETVRQIGGRVMVIPLLEGHSTTGILEKSKKTTKDDFGKSP